MTDPAVLQRRFDRERAARQEAERLLEAKSRELFLAHTELKAQFEELQSAHDQLRRAQEQALQAEKLASIGQLAAGVAHEINTPLGFVISNLNTLSEYGSDLRRVFDLLNQDAPQTSRSSNQTEWLQGVRDACNEVDLGFVLGDLRDLVGESIEGAQRVRQIVADLMNFSKMSNDADSVVSLNALIEQTVRVAVNGAADDVHVTYELGEVGPVRCREGQVSQVVMNLAANAIEALDGGGTITVRSGTTQSGAWFEIQDSGVGIANEQLGRIFDPFYTTKDVGHGTGMGLSQAYRVVEDHGGTITVRSAVGRGTTFRVELPLGGASAEDANGQPREQKLSAATAGAPS